MKKLFLLLALIATASFTACKDEDTTTGPTTGSTYQPTYNLSWWATDEYDTDSLGNIIQESKYSSTMTAGTSFNLNGKTATNFIHTGANGGKDTTILAVEGTVVYMDGSTYEKITDMTNVAGDNSIDLKLNLPWVKIADAKLNSWEIAKVPFADIDVTEMSQGYPSKMSGNTTIMGYKKGTANVTIKGKSYTAQEFNIVSSMSSTVTSSGMQVANVSLVNTQKLWFVENVGLVKQEFAPTTYQVKYTDAVKQYVPTLEDINIVSGGMLGTVNDYKIIK